MPPTPASFFHDYFNVHQINVIASTYNGATAKDSLCYLDGIPGKKPNEQTYLGQEVVNCKMWGIMVDWTVSVHEQLQLVAEILHLTVAITDSYLQVDP